MPRRPQRHDSLPPYSYVAAELIRDADGRTEYVQVDQQDALAELRAGSLPELVRYPSLQHMREAVDELRKQRAKKRRERRQALGDEGAGQ